MIILSSPLFSGGTIEILFCFLKSRFLHFVSKFIVAMEVSPKT